MLAKTPTTLLDEIRELISSREPVVRSQLYGKLYFLDRTFDNDEDRDHSPIVWILRAQTGTLDKVKGLFVREGDYETFELLAIARNLFENLVWLRLFACDAQYGLLFYEQFLTQQMQNTESLIAKIEGEIALFEDYERLDSENLDAAFAGVLEGTPSATQIKLAQEKHQTLTAELDERARRSFALYAATAKFNGYSYQCHILREKVIPDLTNRLAEMRKALDSYSAVKLEVLSDKMQGRSKARWNWKDRASDVGMLTQYEFLYSYTSKLLHSTPMNILTDKKLSDSESLTMLEYAFVTIADLFDEIEEFSFPGEISAMYVEV